MTSDTRVMIRQYFDAAASRYLERTSRGIMGWLRKRELELTRVMIPERHDGKALDAGCGPGYYCQLMRERGINVTAVDISPQMVAKVKDLGIPAYVMDIEHSDPPSELAVPFNFVLCAGVIEFADDVRKFLGALRNMAADGGEMVLIAPRAGIFGLFYGSYLKARGIQCRLYTRNNLVKDIEAVGFEPLEVRVAWPMCLAVRARAIGRK